MRGAEGIALPAPLSVGEAGERGVDVVGVRCGETGRDGSGQF